MVEQKHYISPTIDVLLLNNLDVIRTSDFIEGEDGNDIFDDR